MRTTQEELASFAALARQRLEIGDSELGIDELFDLWRPANPSDAEYSENVAAINASIDDSKRGERGTPAGEHSRRLRREFGISR